MIPKAENAYFQYVNAHGGVNGRKIVFKYYDDQYNPANTVPLTKKLVEQDKVFAVYGSLGTAPTLATRDYLNQKGVPQVLVATGDSYWGSQYKKYPWTIGFQPDYPGESNIYGQFIASKVPQAKIGVLIQDDAYGQNYYDGLVKGLGDAKSKIVDVEKYDATQTDVSQQVVKLKAAGANVFALFALPTQTIDALVVATKVGWKPTTFINNVSASPLFMGLAHQERGQHRRRHLRDVSVRLHQQPGHGDVDAVQVDPLEVRRRRRPDRRQQHLRHRERLDDGAGSEAGRAESDPLRADEGAHHLQSRGQPVPLHGREAEYHPDGAVPDRPAEPRALAERRVPPVRAHLPERSLSTLHATVAARFARRHR